MENVQESTSSNQSNNKANPRFKKKDIVIVVLIIIIIIALATLIVIVVNQNHSNAGCSFPPTVSNAAFSPLKNRYSTNDVIIYTCDFDYVLMGSNISSCMEDFSWSLMGANLPSCLLSDSVCSAFLPVVNANINPVIATQSPQPLNTTVTVTCNTGYYLSPSTADFTCRAKNNGLPQYFPAQAPVCLRGCSYPTNNLPGNATFTPQQAASSGLLAQGAPLSITCDSGFTISGPSSHTCQPESSPQFPSLTSNLTVCQPNCPFVSSLTFPANSNVSSVSQAQVSGTMPVGTVATFSCNAGYGLNGTATITCLPTGIYSAFNFNCAIVCPDPPPEIANGSRAMSSSDSAPYFPGMRVAYQCNSGFTANNSSNLMNRCIVQNLNPVWEKNAMELFTICRPNANIVLLLTKTTLSSTCANGQPFISAQRDFVDSFQSAWGNNAINQGPSQIAVGFLRGFDLQIISGFSDDRATRTSHMNTATVPGCGSFSPGILIFAAQRAYAASLNTSIPTYYLLLFDITTPDWIGANENTAVAGLNRATTPIKNVVFPIAVTSSTSPDLVGFFNKYYTTPGIDLQSVTPGLYFDATTSGVTMTSIIDGIVTHCKTNNC